jgi:hypothetical protein
MAAGVRMSGSVGVHVLMLVEDDLEVTSEGSGDGAERLQTGNAIAPLRAREG